MSERFCCNCKYAKKENTLLGTGVGGRNYYWICKVMKGKTVFEYGVCPKFKREGEL